jgi:hypothetical protein
MDEQDPSTPSPAVEVSSSAPPTPPGAAHRRVGRGFVIAVLVAVVGVGGAFVLGRTTAPAAPAGPTSLGDALHRTAQGKLPLGKVSGDDILGLANRSDVSGLIGNALGGAAGTGGSGSATGARGLLHQLLQLLEDQLGKAISKAAAIRPTG